jgi:membrane protein DedA with SNARE-associated domain
MDFDALLREYGYLALLLGTFLEGETILVVAGIAARFGYLELPLVMLTAFAGSLAGDQAAFFVGRRWGKGILHRWPGLRGAVARVLRLLERWNTPLILTFRFYYGLRNAIPFALGTSDVSTRRFVTLNVVGALAWAVALAVGGYFLGAALESMLGRVAHVARWVIVGIIALSAVAWLTKMLVHRARNRRRPAPPDLEGPPPGF